MAPRSVALATVLALTLAAVPASAAEDTPRDPGFVAGVTLASMGGAAVLLSSVGSLVYISRGESAGLWAWLSMLSGAATIAGGVALVNRPPNAHRLGSIAIAAGVASATLGIIGLVLPSAEVAARRRRLILGPTLMPDQGGGAPGVQVGGRF